LMVLLVISPSIELVDNPSNSIGAFSLSKTEQPLCI